MIVKLARRGPTYRIVVLSLGKAIGKYLLLHYLYAVSFLVMIKLTLNASFHCEGH